MQSNRSKAQWKKKKRRNTTREKLSCSYFTTSRPAFFRGMGLLLAAAAHYGAHGYIPRITEAVCVHGRGRSLRKIFGPFCVAFLPAKIFRETAPAARYSLALNVMAVMLVSIFERALWRWRVGVTPRHGLNSVIQTFTLLLLDFWAGHGAFGQTAPLLLQRGLGLGTFHLRDFSGAVLVVRVFIHFLFQLKLSRYLRFGAAARV